MGPSTSGPAPGEADRVPVGVPDDEVVSSPRFLLQTLGEGHAARNVLREERCNVRDLDKRHDERLAVLGTRLDHGIVDELEMETGAISRDRSVERRIAVEEVNRESERLAVERRRRRDVSNEHYWYGASEPRRRGIAFSHRCASFSRGEVRPSRRLAHLTIRLTLEMKSFLVLLCLVTTATVVAAEPQDDAPGGPTGAPALRVREVRFAGDAGVAPEALQKALEALDTLHVIPG